MARTHGQGNPKWTFEETILALELYQKSNGDVPNSEHEAVRALSTLLRALPFHKREKRKANFRNAAGVAFKLQNLRQVATGLGMPNGSEIDRQVWSKFGNKPAHVKKLAAKIRRMKA